MGAKGSGTTGQKAGGKRARGDQPGENQSGGNQSSRSTAADGSAALTRRQQEILDLIRTKVASRGYPPSVREIGEAVGLSSPSTVHSHLSSLVQFGYLRRDPSKPRAIEVVDPKSDRSDASAAAVHTAIERGPIREVPLVGHVAAGSPILAEQHIDEVFPLPESLVGTGPVFMLKVRGDSMIEDGILDGDYVVIRQQSEARNGDTVAALIDDEEATIKRFERSGDTVTLHPANPQYEPMVFRGGVEIVGVVVSVLRSL
ncbi:MAG: transcriptional repressor LexA [Acidimicrobiia bacterium]|nr:transcriptional repressor LexA [Acidimicrobiia bacterium]NNC43338.1 transcriptional repressor LexA [Acidimicrobiia bacterium]NNL48113.1 transcriptional repressor LexA [Acidimicrobiia bacterium]